MRRNPTGTQNVSFDELLTHADATQIHDRKKPSRFKALMKLLFITPVFGFIVSLVFMPLTLVFAGAATKTVDAWENLPHDLGNVVAPTRTVLLDRNGDKIAQLFSENRVNVKLADISPNIIRALIDTEDARFYEHGGLDGKGTLRALINNVTSDDTQGASTLTQQLVENFRVVLATNAKQRADAKAGSLRGKVQELRYAVELEKKYTKDEILEMYLNTVYLGNGAYGISAASQRYFSVKPADLRVDQAATLVAMLKSPIDYDPIEYPESSQARRDVVMKRMVTEGDLTDERYRRYIARPTRLKESRPNSGCAYSKYPFYCTLVVSKILSSPEFGADRKDREKFLSQGGLIIRTALDPVAMKITQTNVDEALGRDNRIAAGVAVMEPGTGRVKAIAQNRGWGKGTGKTEIVYANTAQFQPGSTFKPITYAAALEKGIPSDIRLNTPSPATFAGLDNPPGGYRNDDFRGHGVLDVKGATKGSVNTFFVALAQQTGVRNVADMARRLGYTSMPTDLSGREGSITLGAYETSPLQMATVYATFAARGVKCDPVVIEEMKSISTGKNIAVPDGDCHQEILPSISDTVADALQAPFTAGGTASKIPLAGGRKAGGKTGTTNGSAATWFAGFTPQLATAVWIGDPRGGNKYPVENINAYGQFYGTVFGGTVAGPIWKKSMDAMLTGQPKTWLPSPKGISTSLTSRIIPEVRGMKVDEALTLLLDAGFEPTIASKTAKASALYDSPGYVVSMTPAPGQSTGYGTKIVLRLSAGSKTNVVLPDKNKPLSPAEGGQ